MASQGGRILKQAKKAIFDLFDPTHVNFEWTKFEQIKLIPTPSRATSADFNVEEYYQNPVKLKDGFNHIFEQTHVDSFWEDLEFKLKQATSIHPVASRKRKNEEHLAMSLIYPTLKHVVDSISIIPEKRTNRPNRQLLQNQDAVSSHLVIQDEIRMGNASGQPPAVDAAIQISDGETCRVLIPVEVKVEIERKHLYQIAAYVTKVSTADELVKKVVIGIIIDKHRFYLLFSAPYFFLDKSGGKSVPVPLPIVYASRSITWRNISLQETPMVPISPAALLVIACTCYFQLDREKCDEESIDSQIVTVARKLIDSKHKIQPIHDDDDLCEKLEKQEKKIKSLEEKIDELKMQLCNK